MKSWKCPCCGSLNYIIKENLPYGVFDEMVYVCENCQLEVIIGWSAEIEVRTAIAPRGDID